MAALLLGLGVIAAMITRAVARRVFLLVATIGLAATVWDIYERGLRPPRPDLTIRLVLPHSLTTMPVPIEVCGATRTGRPTSPTMDGRWLLVRVDGVQAAEVHQSTLVLPVTPGRHVLSVEINSPYHQEFVPPLKITETIRVVNHGGVIQLTPCKRR